MKENDIYEIIEKNIAENATVLQKIEFPNLNKKVNVFLKREDLTHPVISGNKWRKLKYNLIYAKENGYKTLLSFGGAYSNHIHAFSGAGKMFGFNTIGVIRGEETLPLNYTLSEAKGYGMQIEYVSRSEYRKKREKDFIEELNNKFGNFYLVPEGGTNKLAIKGCTEIVNNIDIDFDYVVSACGTGGTLSGLICGLNGNKKVLGVPVLKGADFLKNEIEGYVYNFTGKNFNNWELKLDYHFGGYAKIDLTLFRFMREFETLNQIKIEPIYIAKMLFAVRSLIENNEIPENSTIVALHTGGMQGKTGMSKKMNTFV
ncbi:MAG: 1-aminocyclopropane-1-carboxylate deaminase/D-cysteine desulfhydrase [Ignavibacteriales bacterium]|nr:1-aminocyclopropane-1-carboxylate deaminase/D-cysteine desulfhydrase [Ignavibacteriales bacterium]